MRLIDADDLKKYIEKLQNETRDMKEMVRFDGILAILDSQPTIEPNRGKWKGYWKSQFMGCDDFGEPIYRDGKIYYCSKCNRRTIIKENFCPNCGAKMEDDSRNSERRWDG